jgi:peptide subunit release factor 1 (eRF1)
MPLSLSLASVLMTYGCPRCGLALTKTGQWFKVAGHFHCAQCGQSVRLTYTEKVALFERYERHVGAK